MNLNLVNYANHVYSEAQVINSQSAYNVAGCSKVFSFEPRDMDWRFRVRNWRILGQKRGNGYWVWKPYFILRVLESLRDGDFLFYCDAGAYFCAALAPLVDTARRDGLDIMAFELQKLESDWTKRDAFVRMQCDSPRFTETFQFLSGFILWKRSSISLQFAREWLRLAQDRHLLTDCPNSAGKPNYPGFQEHRHDQSIFSLLAKKFELPAYRDPSQWGNAFRHLYPNSNYDQLIVSTRKRNAQ